MKKIETIKIKYLCGLFVIEQYRWTKTFLLFGFLPIMQISKYPRVEVFNAKD